MPKKIAFIMDPLSQLDLSHDSTFIMMAKAYKRGYQVFYLNPSDLFLETGSLYLNAQKIIFNFHHQPLYETERKTIIPAKYFDGIMMRKDPPFDDNYLAYTYLLDFAENRGVRVYNRPSALRDINEKLFINQFPTLIPPTLSTSEKPLLDAFIEEHQAVVVKPLYGMAGRGIFKLTAEDLNRNVILETLTQHFQRPITAQKYIESVQTGGDKRVLIINGNTIPYALARFAPEGENRSNIMVGGKTKGISLSERDHEICNTIAPILKEKGVLIAGIDIIGDYLTEINVTSPGCIRQFETQFGINLTDQILDAV